MTDTDANIAIAEWRGWTHVSIHEKLGVPVGFPPTGGEWDPIPDYYHDLNKIHEAELHFRKLHPDKIEAWCEVLMDLTPNEPDYVRILGYLSAPAPQRTRALLVMLGLWKD